MNMEYSPESNGLRQSINMKNPKSELLVEDLGRQQSDQTNLRAERSIRETKGAKPNPTNLRDETYLRAANHRARQCNGKLF